MNNRKIEINFIPHHEQRYPTPGDFYTDENGNQIINISQMGSHTSEMGVAIHEFVESYLCRLAGVTDAEIDAWDMGWKDHPDYDKYAEPGDHPDAPYHEQHKVAMAMEKELIKRIGEDWEDHDARVLGL